MITLKALFETGSIIGFLIMGLLLENYLENKMYVVFVNPH